jgi:hypothetical protein
MKVWKTMPSPTNALEKENQRLIAALTRLANAAAPINDYKGDDELDKAISQANRVLRGK